MVKNLKVLSFEDLVRMFTKNFFGFFADPDYGDLTDPVNGRDVTVEFKTAAELGKSYPETYIRVKPNTSTFLRIQTY